MTKQSWGRIKRFHAVFTLGKGYQSAFAYQPYLSYLAANTLQGMLERNSISLFSDSR